jgi:hypothetical protein
MINADLPRVMGRRTVLCGALAALAGTPGVGRAQDKVLVEVWKSPTCGCCKDWVRHLEANGFAVKTHDSGNTAMRGRLGIPATLGSCHTALVGGYAIEGHVPAADIVRLLAQKPQGALGLAVPGMPIGSPGMDGPEYGGRRDAYDVLLVHKAGGQSVFRSYR